MSKKLLARNAQRWSTYCPLGAKLLSTHECSKKTPQKETREEAENWFKGLDLYNVTTLFVYGIGSGQYYLAAKDWLLEDPEREIVFLEDDLDVIYHLLETELGKDIIFDNQAWLQFFQWDKTEEEKKEDWLATLPYFFFLGDIQISCLSMYASSKASDYMTLSAHLQYLKNVKMWLLTEHMQLGRGFFSNFYRNIVDLPHSYLSDCMFKKFEGVPAIICGGGPSLDKNRELLETLKDRALIFGGGSAMNVLNETGFNPHFGVGIDPNWAQFARLTMNQAFTVPYFYRARMHSEALSSLHGEHLFVRGSAGYDISSWMEEKLGLHGERLMEGNNVVNFSLAIAHALGCNPIIFVGVDLAYTNLSSYGKGVLGHPLYDFNQNLSTKNIQEELLIKKDIYDNDTYTLWKWIMESVWYTDYAERHPELTLINATEGGIGFDKVPNMPLQEAADKFLNKLYDFETWIHGEIQNSQMPESVNEENILQVIKDLESSLTKCEDYCNVLRNHFSDMIKEQKQGKPLPENLFSKEITQKIENLNDEIAFTYVLSQFSDSFMAFAGKSFSEILIEELNEQDQEKAKINKIVINKRRYEFLRSVCKYNRGQINLVLREYAIRKAVSNKIAAPKLAPSSVPVWEDIKGEVKEEFYPDGKIKMRQSIKKGIFQGPSVYYSLQGEVLAHCTYDNGKKEGKAWLFYESGEVYSVQNYINGKWDGIQEFFYKSGIKKSLLGYKNGILDGDVLLFHPNGYLYRKLRFKEGKRDGNEGLWNMGGFLEFEAQYKNNRAIGTSRAMYPNGTVAREVIYDDHSKVQSVNQWNPDGSLLTEEGIVKEDYFDTISKQTNVLSDSLKNLFAQLVQVAPLMGKKVDIDNLQKEMEKLAKIEEEMHKHAEETEGKESIWKTPSARRLMGKQLKEASRKMTEDISLMQDALKTASELILKNLKNKKNGP